jgi:elongation factor P
MTGRSTRGDPDGRPPGHNPLIGLHLWAPDSRELWVTIGHSTRFCRMGIIASNMRRGMAIMFNGEPARVLDFHHHTPGNLRALVQAKLRKLRTGIQFEHRFRATDTIDIAELETHDLDFMYKSGTTYHFMNAENYDQLEVEEEDLGDSAKWMTEGMRIIAEFYEGRPIGVQMPSSLVLVVTETAPVMKTATKTASSKPALLNNGISVNVPEFIQVGERIRVNPETGEYLDRAKD